MICIILGFQAKESKKDKLGYQVSQEIYEENYRIHHYINTYMVKTHCEWYKIELSYFWKMLDVNEKFDESSTCSEIKEFFMFL